MGKLERHFPGWRVHKAKWSIIAMIDSDFAISTHKQYRRCRSVKECRYCCREHEKILWFNFSENYWVKHSATFRFLSLWFVNRYSSQAKGLHKKCIWSCKISPVSPWTFDLDPPPARIRRISYCHKDITFSERIGGESKLTCFQGNPLK